MKKEKRQDKNDVWARVHVGTTVSVGGWSETHIQASGGGYIDPQFGGHAPTVRGVVKDRVQVFSKDAEGKETSFELGFAGVPMRDGSKIMVAWASEDGSDRGPYLYVENLDTNDSHSETLDPPKTHGLIGVFIVNLIIGAIVFGALSITFMIQFPKILEFTGLTDTWLSKAVEGDLASFVVLALLWGIPTFGYTAWSVKHFHRGNRKAILRRESMITKVLQASANVGMPLRFDASKRRFVR